MGKGTLRKCKVPNYAFEEAQCQQLLTTLENSNLLITLCFTPSLRDISMVIILIGGVPPT